MVSQVEVNLDMINIYLISSDFLKDKIFKFSDQQILRIMVLKEIKGLSLRGIVKELHSNEAYLIKSQMRYHLSRLSVIEHLRWISML